MRVVLDTDVLIAAFVSRGACHELLEHCEREHRLVTSGVLLAEFREKLEEKFKVPGEKAAAAEALLRAHAELVEPEALPGPVCRDPDDDLVLATAVAGGCACIVTGNRDLLTLGGYRGVRILAPRDFWSYEAGGGPS